MPLGGCTFGELVPALMSANIIAITEEWDTAPGTRLRGQGTRRSSSVPRAETEGTRSSSPRVSAASLSSPRCAQDDAVHEQRASATSLSRAPRPAEAQPLLEAPHFLFIFFFLFLLFLFFGLTFSQKTTPSWRSFIYLFIYFNPPRAMIGQRGALVRESCLAVIGQCSAAFLHSLQ